MGTKTCRIRPDLLKQGLHIPIGMGLMIHTNKPFEYRWLRGEGFEILYHGNWLPATSIDFEFSDPKEQKKYG